MQVTVLFGLFFFTFAGFVFSPLSPEYSYHHQYNKTKTIPPIILPFSKQDPFAFSPLLEQFWRPVEKSGDLRTVTASDELIDEGVLFEGAAAFEATLLVALLMIS